MVDFNWNKLIRELKQNLVSVWYGMFGISGNIAVFLIVYILLYINEYDIFGKAFEKLQ